MTTPPKIEPKATDPVLTAGEVAQIKTAQIKDQKERLRIAILALRKQVRNPAALDSFLGCLTPAMAFDGRLPFTPRPVITAPDKAMVLYNLLGNAILMWGKLARDEKIEGNGELHLQEIEKIAANNFRNYWAYPKERNSAVMVLRTLAEEKEIRTARVVAAEAVLDAKAKRMESEGNP